jgi:ABC-type antimicrobial peptide transport system permease subunit
VSLLNREFAIILAIAAVVGATGGYYVTSLLLSTLFAYHVPVSLAPVVACGVVVFAMGLLTTSATILRAARANPVDTLRSE